MPVQKNLLFIVLDQLNARCLGYQNHPDVKTPNIDQLRQESVAFSHCHVQSPVCHPSRVCFFTGQYQRTHRQYGFEGMLSPDLPSMPKHFRSHGYRTGAAGKLHVNSMGMDLGFDFVAPTLPEDEARASDPELWYPRYLEKKGYRWPSNQCHGKSGLDYVPDDGIQRSDGLENYLACADKSSVPWEHSNEYWTTERGLDFLKECDGKEDPFFLWLSYDRPHAPHGVSAPYDTFYDPKLLTLLASESKEQLLKLPIDYLKTNLQWAFSEEALRQVLACYYAIITSIDDEIGRVVDVLKKTNRYENTTIVFVSDHGDMAGMHRTFEKGRLHEQIIRVPLLIKPACREVTVHPVIEEPIESIDLFPTLAAMHGIPVTFSVDGRDLSEAIDAGCLDLDHVTFSEQYSIKVVIKHGWKLVYYLEQARGMLFDLNTDPLELNNLYQEKRFRDKRIALKKALVEKLAPESSERDQREIEVDILSMGERFEKYNYGTLGWDNKAIYVTEGRGLYCVQDNPLTSCLYYRMDGKSMLLDATKNDWYQNPIRCHSEDLLGERFEYLLDGLIDWLIRSITPINVHAFQAMREERQYPIESEVDAYLERIR